MSWMSASPFLQVSAHHRAFRRLLEELARFLCPLHRHRDFLAKESQAANDEERLQIFADYIIGESVLRRRRYSGARQVDLLRIRQRLFDENDPAAIAALRPPAVAPAPEEPRARPENRPGPDQARSSSAGSTQVRSIQKLGSLSGLLSGSLLPGRARLARAGLCIAQFSAGKPALILLPLVFFYI